MATGGRFTPRRPDADGADMFEVRYDLHDPATDQKGELRIAGGIWTGDVCVFEWTDTLNGLVGAAACDWRCSSPTLDVVEGDASSPATRQLLLVLERLLRPFHRGAFADVTDRELDELYAGGYHAQMNLSVADEAEARFKRHLLDQAMHLGLAGKVLDAGCSAGETVRQLRARGVDAWGFDLCRDLDRIAYPEVRDVLRTGSVTDVPFGPEDGFDTLLALDLFEHIPEDRVPRMVQELARLNVTRVIAHIALVEFQYPGHLTLRPLSWWDRAMQPAFRRVSPPGAAAAASGFGGDPSRYLRVYERVAVPLLAR